MRTLREPAAMGRRRPRHPEPDFTYVPFVATRFVMAVSFTDAVTVLRE